MTKICKYRIDKWYYVSEDTKRHTTASIRRGFLPICQDAEPLSSCIFVNIDTNEVTQDIRKHDNGEKISHPFLNSDVQVFDIEAAVLKSFEPCLNLPSLLIHFELFFGIAIRDKDLKLRLSLLVLDFSPRQAARLPVDIIDTIKMLAFTKS